MRENTKTEYMVNGKVTDQWYMHMSQKYELERSELQDKIKNYRVQLLGLEDVRHEKEHFLAAIRTFMRMQTLTPVLLRELIDKIEVHRIEGTGKNRTQRITIHYNYQGLSDEESMSYVVHKLNCAGSSKAIIDEAALRAVASHTHGNPRLIDNLMSDALVIGAQQDKKSIDTDVILAAVNNQNLG